MPRQKWFRDVLSNQSRMRNVPWLVLLLMLATTYLLWNSAMRNALQNRQAEFVYRVHDISGRIRQRILDYEQMLYGARAFFANQHQVEHREFRGYISGLRLQDRFSNIQTVGVVNLVERSRKSEYEQAMRRDGLAGYSIHPPARREIYAPIAYLEPVTADNRQLLGFDCLSNPELRKTLGLARDLDQSALVVNSGVEPGLSGQHVALMFLPMYQNGTAHDSMQERRAHITGWLAVTFSVSGMMADLLQPDKGTVVISAYDNEAGTSRQLLFDSGSGSVPAPHLFSVSSQVRIDDHAWQLEAYSLPEFERGMDTTKAQFIAIAGTIMSFLLAALAALLVRDRARALQFVERADQELRDRQEFQLALLESEERYRELFEFANEFIITTDIEGNVTSVNHLTFETLGYTHKEMLAMNISDFMTPESLVRARQMTAKKLSGESVVTRYELDLRTRGGTVIPTEFSTRLVYKSGKPAGVHAIGHDITERLRYEQALRDSEEKYRSVFDNAQDFIFTIDTSSRLTSVTSYFYEITGYGPDEVIGVQIGKFLTRESLSRVQQMIGVKMAGDMSVTRYEIDLVAKDGHITPVELNTSLTYKYGKLVGSQGIGRDITERRQYEQALLESEEKYRGLFDNAGDFAYSHDLNGKFTAVSEALLEAMGYAREELTSISQILSTEELARAGEMTASKMATGQQVTRYELELTTKDGRRIPTEIVSSLISRNGEPVGVQGIGRDISERKHAEEALRRSERNYRELMEQAADAIFVADHDGQHYVDVNQAACDLLGYSREELIGRDFKSIFHPEDIVGEPIKFDEMWSGHVIHTRRRFRRKDGSYVPVELSGRMLSDGRLQALARDVSEWLEREAALRQSEQKWHELMEQATEAIAIYDQDMRCVDINRAAEEMFGYQREEFLGMGMRDLVHPDDQARLAQPEERAKLKLMLEGKLTIQGERRMRRKDGVYIPVQISAKRLSDGRILSIKRNISEWLEREAALREANAKAESASRAKSEFLANMSHEIRTPMNSVIGMAHLALLRESDPMQRSYLEKILLSGEHLLGIIDDILDFSKIDAGKLGIEFVLLDIGRIMESVVSLVTEKARAKNLRLVQEIEPGIPNNLCGDPLRLRQVLLNYADNAVKFTNKGEVAVVVRKLEQDANGCLLRFEVRDTGIGMDEQELAGLFQSFQQADGSVTRNYGGTGLGLAISKKLVELMGGDVGVASELGKGSTFWFQVPLRNGREKSAAAGALFDLEDQNLVRNRLHGKRVLLVENNLFNQQVAREFLENVDVVAVVANNGAEALDLLRHEQFDAVLMDLQMPVMDGLEATLKIRANPDHAAMPVIAMTANALEEERQRCLAAGMNDFITKPVRPEILYAILAAQFIPHHAIRQSAGAAEMTHATADTQPLDLSVLEELVGGRQERVRELAYKFLLTTRHDFGRLDDALDRQDVAQLRSLGHHIKSPSALVGADHLAGLCRELEEVPDDLDGVAELVQRMRIELERIETQVRERFPE